MNINKAKDKVTKLMALAKNAGATESEAESAMRQAEILMRKFGIDATDCELSEARAGFDWGSQFTAYGNKYHQAKSLPAWYQFIAVGVATFTDTIARQHRKEGQGLGIGFYGEKSDIGFAVWLLEYLRDTVQSEAVRNDDLSRSGKEAFRKGMALRLSGRLRALRKERDNEFAKAQTPKGTGFALVVVNNKINERDQQFGAPSYKTKAVAISNSSAAARGQRAGESVGFNKPLAQSNGAQGRLAA